MLYKLTNFLIKPSTKRKYSVDLSKFKPPWKVLFFGTDQFSLESLKALNTEYRNKTLIDRLEIATNFKNKSNPIYRFGIQENLRIHRWPLESKIEDFHVGLVVSFGYLIPEKLIESFPLGMLNVHASLLPRWRGAAPIIHALANGDSKTGVSIMRIKPKHFDIGEILQQSEFKIPYDMTLPILYSELSLLGATTLTNSLHNLIEYLSSAKPQGEHGATYAPKITSSFAEISFHRMTAKNIYNLNRALEGLYALTTKFNSLSIKLYDVQLCNIKNDTNQPGHVFYDKIEKNLKIKCSDQNFVSVEQIGVHNKKVMSAIDFNNGYLKKEVQRNRLFS